VERVGFDGQVGGAVMIVYLATNTVNGMQYVGITTRTLKDRERGHFSSANRGKGSEGTFPDAIRKFGCDKFVFEVIDRASSVGELKEKENMHITRLMTLSPNGYNKNKGGALAGLNGGHPILINGVAYSSKREAAYAFGLCESQLSARLKKGWTMYQACGIEGHPDGRSWIKLKVGGKRFENFREACEYFEVNERTALCRYKKGYPLEKVFSKKSYKGVKTVIEGKTFFTRVEAAKAYNIDVGKLNRRLSYGWTIEQAVGLANRR
jgi:hypothetical protein